MSEPATSLPERFAIFPLRNVLLLPGGNLPLNIFEPRYLQMVRDAMRTERLIGMIQTRHEDDPAPAPPVYRTGCVGRISAHKETMDGRIGITLTGVCRFDIVRELDDGTAYRQIIADFGRWRGDLQPATPPDNLKLDLLPVLHAYFDRHGIDAEWEAIEQAPLAGLITSLAMICPFEPPEKQALVEAVDLAQQGRLLVALMQMDCLGDTGTSTVKH